MKPSKKTRRAEGRDRPERIPQGEARIRTQSRVILMPNLERVNAAAKQAVQTRFTSLLHHVDQAALHRAFRRQKRQASAGVDGMTVAKYEERLEQNLHDLCDR
ncbi:group II intron reverse transcriptase/maturase, partial [Sinorhizobium meliloti]